MHGNKQIIEQKKRSIRMGKLTDGVYQATLDNGLTVIVKENHAASVSACLAFVKAGYFHESDRVNGIAHVIEHMFFKGTQKRPCKEQIAEAVRAIGGYINASTYYEETAYHITAPSKHMESAVEILSDMFLHPLFDADELARELEVIIQESHQKRDNPQALLVETMYARAFDKHRIRRWRIGEDENLRKLNRNDLLEFTGNLYRPENIVLSIVGDVAAKQAVEIAHKYWSDMSQGKVCRDNSPHEPAHQEFRFERMRGDIQQKLFTAGYHAPGLLHEDSPALVVLGALLSDGRSSRLYRRVREEKKLVNSIWAGYEGFEEMGIFTLGGDCIADDPLNAERATIEEVARLVRGPINEQELERVKTRIKARRLFELEETLGMARALAEYQALGDYHLADDLLNRLMAVNALDIQRIASKYLSPDKATLVEYLPVADGMDDKPRILNDFQTSPLSEDDKTPAILAASPPLNRREKLHLNEKSIYIKQRNDLPIISINILFKGGKLAETSEISGLTNLMVKSSLKGAGGMNAEELAERIESLGSNIIPAMGNDVFGYSLKIQADHFRDGLEILRKVICEPTFSPEELEREKLALLGEIRRMKDSMYPNAMDQFNQACFGNQAYGLPSVGFQESIEKFTPQQVRDWHSQWVCSSNAVISIVGDADNNALKDYAEWILSDMPSGSPFQYPVNFYLSPGESTVSYNRKQTASVMGFPGASMKNDDRHALDVLAEISSGLAGRFFQAVRGEKGLAYAVHASHRAKKDCGNFLTYTATSPEKEIMAREIILQECDRFCNEMVSDEELSAAKTAIEGTMLIGLQSYGAQTAIHAYHRAYDLPDNEMENYLARVNKVTADELMETAIKYLRPDKVWIGTVRGYSSEE
jgi:zinc protease